MIQEIQPFVSEQDIAVGTKWEPEIAKNLSEAKFGIICVTPENQSEPWINYEVGALSKLISTLGRVVPLLIGMEPPELKPPLSLFQAQTLTRDGVKEIVSELNRSGSTVLPDGIIEAAFNRLWTEFESEVAETMQAPLEVIPGPARSERDMMSELLELVRAMSRETTPSQKISPLSLFEQLQNIPSSPGQTPLDPHTAEDFVAEFFREDENFIAVTAHGPHGLVEVQLATDPTSSQILRAKHLGDEFGIPVLLDRRGL